MPESLWEVQSLSKRVAEHVTHAVGKVGVRSEGLDDLFNPLESVKLSRGGLVVTDQSFMDNYKLKYKIQPHQTGEQENESIQSDAPDLEVPEYHAELAVVSHYIKPDDSNYFDKESAHYVFERGSNGVWKGLKLSLREASHNAHTEVDTYYLPKAEIINTKVQAAFILGLCQKFDEAREKRIRTAIKWDSVV